MHAAVQEAMASFAALTGRSYSPLEYIGHPHAEQVIVAMGAGATVVEKTVYALAKQDTIQKVGVLKVRLYRPWSDKDLLNALPATSIKRLAVLEPSRDLTSTWNPLFLDAAAALYEMTDADGNDVEIVSGQYGVEAEDFSPIHVQAVFTELSRSNLKRKFDVSQLTLDSASKIQQVVSTNIEEQFIVVGDEQLALQYARNAVVAGKNAQVYTVGNASYVRISSLSGSLLPSLVYDAEALVLQKITTDASAAIGSMNPASGVVAIYGSANSLAGLHVATKKAIGSLHLKVVYLENPQELIASPGLCNVLAKSKGVVIPNGWDQLVANTDDTTNAIPTTVNSSPLPVETPYLKMLEQVFQDRLEIANAVNSDSIWSTKDNSVSLSPEFGYGKIVNKIQERARFIDSVEALIKGNNSKVSEEANKALTQWLLTVKSERYDIKAINRAADAVLSSENGVLENKDLLYVKSNWLIGSDSWAYDLGQSGVHHVIAQGENVNMLIVDTLPYSEGVPREQRKKDIGLYAMNFGNVYVASVAVYSSYTGVLHALMEADAYNGPSIVLAYLPQQSEVTSSTNPLFTMKETKVSVDNGSWPLYRWNPALEAENKDPFTLDSQRIKKDLEKFLERENHFSQIVAQHPDLSDVLVSSLENVKVQ